LKLEPAAGLEPATCWLRNEGRWSTFATAALARSRRYTGRVAQINASPVLDAQETSRRKLVFDGAPLIEGLRAIRLFPPRSPRCASGAARCVACHDVRSHGVPVALVGECSIPVV